MPNHVCGTFTPVFAPILHHEHQSRYGQLDPTGAVWRRSGENLSTGVVTTPRRPPSSRAPGRGTVNFHPRCAFGTREGLHVSIYNTVHTANRM